MAGDKLTGTAIAFARLMSISSNFLVQLCFSYVALYMP